MHTTKEGSCGGTKKTRDETSRRLPSELVMRMDHENGIQITII